ncbi:S-type pyocin domain-containing protein [Raoultella terrigena]|uniref:S-type pyocin domain-containing protein n=1 Tax=Raoultella terrigena TaxID=577 RepID=UPI0020C96E64|nr:S-type pyocin domain-containing protein [Raoultella terrigena]
MLQGDIPAGFWLNGNRVMTRARVPYLINGGGKGDDRTGYRDKDVEVPSLTEAYHTSQAIQAELAEAARQAEADRLAAEAARKAEEARLEEEARKAEEARRAEEARKAEQARQALFAKAGILPTPVYTPEKAAAGSAALAKAGAMALNRAPGTLQLSTMAEGVMGVVGDLAGWMASAIWRGAVAVSEVAVVSPVGPMVGAFVVGFTPLPVGAGSDRVPGRDIGMLAVQARLMAAGKVSIEPGMSSVNLPVRGFIRTGSDGRQSVSMVKTGTGGVPASVPVLNAVRDEVTGLDRITVPAVAGAPSRTILINPVPSGPTVPANTGNTGPVPKTPVHTGTDIRQADSIVTTTYPAAEDLAIQDFIYWQPDATGSGVEPVYVMLNGPYGETNARGKYSGREYNTDKAGGPVQELNWKDATIDRAGIDKVRLHTGRFESTPENVVMIDRLEKILRGELQATDTDSRYYTHEIRELDRYRNLGIKDGEVPENKAEVWNNTHTATLEDYRLSSDETLLYTPEALNSEE